MRLCHVGKGAEICGKKNYISENFSPTHYPIQKNSTRGLQVRRFNGGPKLAPFRNLLRILSDAETEMVRVAH